MASKLALSQSLSIFQLDRKSEHVQPEEDFDDVGSEWEETKADFAFLYAKISKRLSVLFAPPTRTEVHACWELSRLRNGMTCATVFLPVAWSLAMVYHAHPTLSGVETIMRTLAYLPLCMGVKCMIMTIDDILDHDIDALVERTKNRAIPRGAISLERAWLFFAIQVIIGVSLAFTCLSSFARRVSMLVWPIFILYPTCKRWTSFAPVPLGLMFNIGVFMGWADLSPTSPSSLALLPVYGAAIMWTITYETVYQHQDKVDDTRIGMRSLALYLGERTLPVCALTSVLFGLLMVVGGHLNGQGISFYGAVGAATGMLLWGLSRTDINDPGKCLRFFLLAPKVGDIVLAGLVLDGIAQRLMGGISL